jgi:hypothetical protein
MYSVSPPKVQLARPSYVMHWLPAFLHGCRKSPSNSSDEICSLTGTGSTWIVNALVRVRHMGIKAAHASIECLRMV